ncbi:MAG: orotidine-5'-phosphate decarboxylase [Candidatus Kapaibacterium sp.]
MKAIEKLKNAVKAKKSLVCVGLDPDLKKTPGFLGDGIRTLLNFNKAIIDATKDIAAAYKLNFAFYEQYGIEGIEVLKETFDYIPDDIFTIADAKRGDIGNTSLAYAVSVFDYFGADSITLSPYMGSDSIEPFLKYENKMAFLLCVTSNKGSHDFQRLDTGGKPLYQRVIEESSKWAGADRMGYVSGATHPEELAAVRKAAPDNVLLIPGIGAQGGELREVMRANAGGPALINSSRGIIYASSGPDFDEKAAYNCKIIRDSINEAL